MAATAEAQEKVVRIARPKPVAATVRIRGTSPLLTNRWTEKAIADLTNTEPKKRGGPRVFEDPEKVWRSHLHTIDADMQRYGIPGAAIHGALIKSARFIEGVFMTELRGMFRIPFHLLEIEGSAPVKHFAIGRPQKTGPPMPVYRPLFAEWEIDVPVSYDSQLIEIDALISLFARAGYSIGIGAFRPECEGTYGTFEVKEVSEAKS